MGFGALYCVSLTASTGADEVAQQETETALAEPSQKTLPENNEPTKSPLDSTAVPETVDFNRDVRPILAAKCYACHGPDEESREADLELHIRERAIAELESGTLAIIPGKSNESELIARLLEEDEDLRMPPPEMSERLEPDEIDLLRLWIDQGATYAGHWSYVRLTRPSLPEVQNTSWCRSPIDYFVLARLEAAGLEPEAEADRYRLVRRLSLDLIGLPPTIEEVDAFVSDDRPDAYERLVDRLLASPHYGEHWARKWLDMARYADSKGYAQDELRNIWRYRDWVIEAFNRDLPFDQFTIEQLAGDLMPEPTKDQLVATAFHRNTMTNTEGGTDDEEFRVAAVVDRVNTTMQVWMGITMGCAQCHTHKFDPIKHEEYYQMFAIFNQTSDYDQPDERPTIFAPSAEQQEQLTALKMRLTTLEKALGVDLKEQTATTSPESAESEKTLIEKTLIEKTLIEKTLIEKTLTEKTLTEETPEVKTPAKETPELAKLKKELDAVRNQVLTIESQRTPVMSELPMDEQRETRIHIRGSFLSKGKEVSPQTPEAFGYLSEEGEKNRLALARWIVSAENPLTARVAANRHWEQLFGVGLVTTSEDFGTQGALPSHPRLLDWLAVEFCENGWSMKQLCKTIVMSAAYRQSSEISPEKLAQDPANQLISRGARFRLSAEQIRDYALASSGLLSKKLGGPSVRPPQPNSGLLAAFGESLDWAPSTEEDRYRRGLYTLIRRVSPYPSLMALGATGRTTCTIRRVRTNTPVGAFVTLNDPVFIEAAQALARKTIATSQESLQDRMTFAFRSVLARKPSTSEIASLTELFTSTLDHYRSEQEAAKQMATVPLGPSPEKIDLAELASWTVVGNVLLNLDESLTKD